MNIDKEELLPAVLWDKSGVCNTQEKGRALRSGPASSAEETPLSSASAELLDQREK